MAALVHIHESGEPGRATRVRPGDTQKSYAGELAAELGRRVKGEVRFDDGSRALYATDGSNYRQTPIGVVLPKDTEDIVETMALCRRFGAPVLARGGGTSLAGQCCNVAVVIDCSKYMRGVLELDSKRKLARVQPGIVLDQLNAEAGKCNLIFAPDPATHSHCTLGGMIGNNSCGVHSVMAGKTDDNVEELDLVTYDGVRMRVGKTGEEQAKALARKDGREGEIYRGMLALRDRYADLIRARFPNIPRRVSGYNLDRLLPERGFDVAKALVGSESTLVFVLEAKVRLVYSPPFRALVVLGYPDIYQAADHIIEILEHKPIGLEGMDDMLVENMRKKGLHVPDLTYLPDGKGWLLVEFGGEDQKEADHEARRFMKRLSRDPQPPSMKLYEDKEEEGRVWQLRRSCLGATAFVPGEPVTWEGWEDSAVPPDKLGSYLREMCDLYHKYGYRGALYGHFGQGCVHTRLNFDFNSAEGIDKYRRFVHEAAHTVVRYGGSLSGEHGDGQSRAELLPIMFGKELVQAFNEFKTLWDPDLKMNPGKVVYPYRVDENLRHGADYNPPQPQTHFAFREEGGW
ncbi:MAG TPA: FAD-binding oxidoreductase, partial [Bryobacteraceae bacterium]|nr:FAD-binding oxidoreductase [Bryobacteraceae bacterium]